MNSVSRRAYLQEMLDDFILQALRDGFDVAELAGILAGGCYVLLSRARDHRYAIAMIRLLLDRLEVNPAVQNRSQELEQGVPDGAGKPRDGK